MHRFLFVNPHSCLMQVVLLKSCVAFVVWACHFCITVSLAHRFVTSYVQIVFHLYFFFFHMSSAHVGIVCVHLSACPFVCSHIMHSYSGSTWVVTSCSKKHISIQVFVVCCFQSKKKNVLWMAMPISCLNLFVCLDATKREDGTRRWGSLKRICLRTRTFGSEELSGRIVKKVWCRPTEDLARRTQQEGEEKKRKKDFVQ